MATVPTPDEILAAFRAAGLAVVEMPGWRDRCRCHTGPHRPGPGVARAWLPWRGITVHHTAGPMLYGDRALAYTRNILIGGNGSVPGPLCLAGIDGDGRIIMVSAGRANHVGSISRAAVNAMAAASFSLSGYQDLRGRGIDGNAITLGFEILAPGAPSATQRQAVIRASAALCRLAGWTGQEVHGHGEVSDQRDYSDPGLDMGAVRREVMALVSGQPQAAEAPPTKEKEKDVAGINMALDPNGTVWALWDDGAACELQTDAEVEAVRAYKAAIEAPGITPGAPTILGDTIATVSALRYRAEGRWPKFALDAVTRDVSTLAGMIRGLPQETVDELVAALTRQTGAGMEVQV